MLIKQILNEGELLDAEMLSKIHGGGSDSTGSNNNTSKGCTCTGSGDNTNSAENCKCGGSSDNTPERPPVNPPTPPKPPVVINTSCSN